jgi:biopolymer transport protein ExbB/TolQ
MEIAEFIYTSCINVGLVFILMLIVLLIHLCIKLSSLINQEEDFYNLQKRKMEASSTEMIAKDKGMLEYTEALLKSIREAITAVSAVKYRDFSDNHTIEKITKEHFKGMIEDVIVSIKEDINFANIDYDNLIYTKEYINRYIIDTTVYILKNMFNDELNNA